MRILFLSSVFPWPDNPARGTFNFHLCKALHSRHEVRALIPWPWTAALRHRDPGRGAGEDGLRTDYSTFYYPPGLLHNQHGRFMWLSVRGALHRLVAEFAPDCIIGYWAHPDGEAALRAARSLGVPLIQIVGGSDVLLVARRAGRRRRIVEVLRGADAVVAVGRDLRDKILEFGIPAEKVHIVPRGIDTELFAPGGKAEARRRLGLPASDRILLWVGRIHPVKGLDILIAACDRLRARGVGFRLYLVGDGPQRRALEVDCAGRGLGDAVRFIGRQRQDGLPDWYRAADLMVLPSRSEGIPNVLREALACGTPFVASHVGGIPELAGEPWGRLVAPEDPAALAEAIARGLSEPAPAEPPWLPGWEEAAESMLQILRSLVPAPPGRGALVGLLPDDPIAHLP